MIKSVIVAAAMFSIGASTAVVLSKEAGSFDGRVVVVDGDTIKVGSQRVRLWGIDSPEMYTSEGRVAKEYLRTFVQGKEVHCLAMDKDRYGRTVAQCWLNGKDLAWYMVEGGHAKDWPKYSNGYYGRQR